MSVAEKFKASHGKALALVCMLPLVACAAPPPPPLPAPLPANEQDRSILLSTLEDQIAGKVETSLIDLGTPEGSAHLRSGWLWPEELEDGTTIVWAEGEQSSFEIWITTPRTLTLKSRGWPYKAPDDSKQFMTLDVNGEEVGEWRMRPGMREASVKIPARFLTNGVNVLTLRPSVMREQDDEPRISAGFDRLELSPTQTDLPFFDGPDLHLPAGSGLDLFFFTPTGSATLVFEALEGSAESRLELTVHSDEKKSDLEVIAGVQKTPGSLDLKTGSTRVSRLTITSQLHKTGQPPLILRSPRLVMSQSEAEKEQTHEHAAWPRFAAQDSSAPRPNVLLYLVDTLRADRLGCYGNPGNVSPRIDAFAEQAILFEKTTAQSSWTRASMASIITGFSAGRHGVETRLDALPGEALTLAELLSAAGYATAGVLTNGNAGRDFGFDQGFDSFELLGEVERGVPSGVERVNARAKELLDGPLAASDKPFFLYLHTMEPHAPYVIPEPLPGGLEKQQLPQEVVDRLRERGAYTEGPTDFGSVAWIQALFHRLLEADLKTGKELNLAYEASILHNDRYFGDLLDELKARNLLDNTVIVFLSDHGEEFYDHGSWSHGMTLYEEQLRVPFLLSLPGADAPRGVRSQRRARQVDLLPTLLDYLSLPAPPQLDGESLLTPVEGGERPGFSQLDLDGRKISIWVEGNLKLICPQNRACSLFDLKIDPEEHVDLAPALPVTTDYMHLRLEKFNARSRALAATKVELNPELEQQLKALGYL